MVGDICVGKTAIFTQVQHPGTYAPDMSQATLSATFAALKFEVDDKGLDGDPQMIAGAGQKKQVKIHLWDTAGDDKLKNLTKQYFQGASGAVVVYDCTNKDSLETAEQWIDDVRQNAPADCLIYLAGNKQDDIEKIEVSRREGQKVADNKQVPFYETSAKENTGI